MKIFILFFIGLLALPSWVLANPGPKDFQLFSTAFEDNSMIPKDYTCDGRNVSPSLSVRNTPTETKSLALTVSDPDAPNGRWSHWVVFNIPSNTVEIPQNTVPGTSGVNDFGTTGYGGPCPPAGRIHHYIFRIYALDMILSVNGSPAINEIEKDIQGHIIAESQWVGTYLK